MYNTSRSVWGRDSVIVQYRYDRKPIKEKQESTESLFLLQAKNQSLKIFNGMAWDIHFKMVTLHIDTGTAWCIRLLKEQRGM